jgi:hypothetical protein
MGFKAYQDEFSHEGSTLVRHLISIRISEISPVSDPAYIQTGTALRHLAQQFGEDPEDVFELAKQNELRRLFTRTDIAPAVPTPAEARGMDARRAQQLSEALRPPEAKPGMSARAAILELHRLRMDWDAPISGRDALAYLAANPPYETAESARQHVPTRHR